MILVLLKKSSIANPLASIFNCFFITGQIPDELKFVKATAIFKNGDYNAVSLKFLKKLFVIDIMNILDSVKTFCQSSVLLKILELFQEFILILIPK